MKKEKLTLYGPLVIKEVSMEAFHGEKLVVLPQAIWKLILLEIEILNEESKKHKKKKRVSDDYPESSNSINVSIIRELEILKGYVDPILYEEGVFFYGEGSDWFLKKWSKKKKLKKKK